MLKIKNNKNCNIKINDKAISTLSAKEMFEQLGYTYQYIDNKNNNCEDVIIYTHNKTNEIIQFNLFSKLVVYQVKNVMKEYEKIAFFITKELVQAVNKQIEELGWNK